MAPVRKQVRKVRLSNRLRITDFTKIDQSFLINGSRENPVDGYMRRVGRRIASSAAKEDRGRALKGSFLYFNPLQIL
jgi:hypothetical protein